MSAELEDSSARRYQINQRPSVWLNQVIGHIDILL